MIRVIALMVLCAAALHAAGRDGLARLALALHAPSIAWLLTGDHALAGAALYQRGDYRAAAEQFRLAGASSTYNRGNALARLGDYGEAVGAYDAVLARDPSHGAARANRALIIGFIASETEKGGGNRPQGDRQGERSRTENKNDSMTLLEAEEAQRQRAIQVMRPMESKAMIADAQWLEAMPDEPGRYLKLRIAAEHQRRLQAGTAAPEAADPW